VFFIILVVSVVQWFVDGKRNFHGPRVDIDALQNGEVVGMEPTGYSEDGSTAAGSFGNEAKNVDVEK
jgi:choline transport protein